MGGACSADDVKKPPRISRTRSSFDVDDCSEALDVSIDFTDYSDRMPTTTFVRALPLGKTGERISRASWSRQMQAIGRIVVEDKQFQAGGYIRSVPRLLDASNATILMR